MRATPPGNLAGIKTPVQYNHFVRVLLWSVLMVAAACAPGATDITPPGTTLRPYRTISPSVAAPEPTSFISSPPVALPSPTPFQYVIKSGDTLSQLAEQFHITLDLLLAANPGVDPNALAVGKALRIPSSRAGLVDAATPTPVELPVEQVACHRIADGGAWCFVLIHNNSADLIENVTAAINLVDSSGNRVDARTALLPLNILPAGQSLPLAAFFPPPLAGGVRPQVQILSAMRVRVDDGRYLPGQVRKQSVQVESSGLSAQLTGEVLLFDASKAASSLRVAAVAYDEAGKVVGVRRWISETTLAAGAALPFSFMISSVAGRIERAEFTVEARP
jgi:LysM repeat protein